MLSPPLTTSIHSGVIELKPEERCIVYRCSARIRGEIFDSFPLFLFKALRSVPCNLTNLAENERCHEHERARPYCRSWWCMPQPPCKESMQKHAGISARSHIPAPAQQKAPSKRTSLRSLRNFFVCREYCAGCGPNFPQPPPSRRQLRWL